jgi:hypothetical protein
VHVLFEDDSPMVEELGGPIVHVQFEDDSPMVEELGGRWCLQRVAPRRGTASVTAAQVAAACFSLLSRLVVDGGVLLWVCLFCSGYVRVVVSASARYVQLLLFLK